MRYRNIEKLVKTDNLVVEFQMNFSPDDSSPEKCAFKLTLPTKTNIVRFYLLFNGAMNVSKT